MDEWDAVSALRYHHQWSPDEIRFDEQISSELEESLKVLGYQLNNKSLGCKIQLVSHKDSLLKSVSDPRGEGSSLSK